MRRSSVLWLLSTFLLAPTLWAMKAEKEAKKLDQELRKVNLTAADLDGRRVVNRIMAKQLGVSRKQLVKERRETGFVYGQLFAAHELAQLARLTFSTVAEQMKQQRSLLEIGVERRVDLKKIVSRARKLNKQIDKELDRIVVGEEDELAEDTADSYDPAEDSLAADTAGFTPVELAQASYQTHHRAGAFGEGGRYSDGRQSSRTGDFGRNTASGGLGSRSRGPR